MTAPGEETAPHYANGVWSEEPDEFMRTWTTPIDHDEALRMLGFSLWTRIGDPGGMDVPMTLTLYLRSQEPQYLMEVEGNGGSIPHVYARTLPDAMDLLAKWAPAVKAAAVTELIHQFNDTHGKHRPAVSTLRELLDRD